MCLSSVPTPFCWLMRRSAAGWPRKKPSVRHAWSLGIEQRKEQVRRIRAGSVLETFFQEVRPVTRALQKSGFAATAVFRLVKAVVLRLLPVANGPQPVQFTCTFPSDGRENWNSYFGYPQLEGVREQATMLSGVACAAATARGKELAEQMHPGGRESCSDKRRRGENVALG